MPNIYSLPVVDESTPGFVQNPRANALLKEATRLKTQGDMKGAVEALEAANIAIAKGKTEYAVDTFVKLPLYLQQAGRGKEAVDKLIQLLDKYPSSWGQPFHRDNDGMIQSHLEKQRAIVYDKLRLVLQREKRYEEAIPYAVLAETYCERIDFRVYQHLADKWENKAAPKERDLLEVKASGGTFKDYMTESSDFLEWHDFNQLKLSFEEGLSSPKLASVLTLLKKIRKTEALELIEKYAYELLNDFEKSDVEVMSDVTTILKSI